VLPAGKKAQVRRWEFQLSRMDDMVDILEDIWYVETNHSGLLLEVLIPRVLYVYSGLSQLLGDETSTTCWKDQFRDYTPQISSIYIPTYTSAVHRRTGRSE
jgi:hypothetical protein